jgi:hypothetical protein
MPSRVDFMILVALHARLAMATTVKAVFDGSVLRPEQPVNLRPNARYLITVEELKEPKEVAATALHPLTQILALATDMGVTDLAERHDRYAHGKLDEPNGQSDAP